MSYDNDQNEYPIPTNNDSNNKRSSASLLPRYFRTDTNKKFLGATLDQLTTPGVAEKINGYVGTRVAKAAKITDSYLSDVSADRENYQFEPFAVVKDNLGNVTFDADYLDYIGQLTNFGANTENHSTLSEQEFDAWDPHIDFDKFTNFREYYWLPNGPQSVPVRGNGIAVTSTYTVTTATDDNNVAFVFTPNGSTRNPSLKLYRGQTYRFEIDTPGHPFAIAIDRSFTPSVFEDSSVNISTVYTDGVVITHDDDNTLVNRTDFIEAGYIEKGVLEFTVPTNAPDNLYYLSQYDINTSGAFRVYDIEFATEIDIATEILGKRRYTTSDNWAFSNGMKVYFQGNVTPSSYANGEYYVEGVGDGIELIPVNDLEVPAIFTQDTQVPFDNNGFDRLPFSNALSFAGTKDYIVINRLDKSRNPWSRYNRWFHKSVIESSAKLNNQTPELDEAQLAKRPIIEFESNLQLFNHGTTAIQNVDVIDTFTKDVFSTIEGSVGYNVDGIDLANGMRVLFTGDPDSLVNGKVFEVKFLTHNNRYQISLIETTDTTPVSNNTVLVKTGTKNAGCMYWYNGTQWKKAQDKTGLNQAPKFDLFDEFGYSYSDEIYYPSSNFGGNRIFSYKIGEGKNDTELGFPLSYKNFVNIGDIVYDFCLLNKTYEYETNGVITKPASDIMYLKKLNNESYNLVNAWKKANIKSRQYVIRRFTGEDNTNNFPVDCFNNSATVSDLVVKVFVNGIYKYSTVDYNLTEKNNNKIVTFVKDLEFTDIIEIKAFSKIATKNTNGYYEIPHNLERNPLNENITEFTLGQVNDHVAGIIQEVEDFEGVQPGIGNIRDLGNIVTYGRKFVKHTGPLNLAMYHLVDKQANIVKAIKFAGQEYLKFKNVFIQTATDLEFDGTVQEHFNAVMNQINLDKSQGMPFYSSDMIGITGSKKIEYTVLDNRNQFYALNKIFNKSVLTRCATYVYVNGTQLIHNKDYVFTTEGFIKITKTVADGDKVDIYEFQSTEGSYVPITPSKIGMYPAYEPELFADTTFQTTTNVIRGHDGSLVVAYNDYRDDLLLELEKRIYNNIKVAYDTSVFDIHDYIPGEYRQTDLKENDINNILIKDFNTWNRIARIKDYTENSFIAQDNSFTFNYGKSVSPNGNKLNGFWRGVYINAYDTDRPNTHPWEMVGFTSKPSWWETQYGPAPYTKDNLVLWRDLETGTIREPNKAVIRNKKYIRPNLTKHIPVTENGQVASPMESSYAQQFAFANSKGLLFKFGDHGPTETAWRRSSHYPFSILTAILVHKPATVMGIGFDRSRITRNSSNNIAYGNTNKSIQLSQLVFPKVFTTDISLTAGLVNYVAEYMSSSVTTNYQTYIDNLKVMKNQLGIKVGGFTDKEKFKLVLDSKTPLNKGNVFVPFENYDVSLRTSAPIKTVYYSGIIVEKVSKGYRLNGYNIDEPKFKYYKAINQANDASITVGGISESYIDWTERQVYVAGKVVKYENKFYRTNANHTSTESFDTTKFTVLDSLPTNGGASAKTRKLFEKTLSTVDYGTVFEDSQEIVDFMYGYGEYLQQQGFDFNYFNKETGVVEDFNLSVKEFVFWLISNWASSTIITISPIANLLKFKSNYTVVDDIFDNFHNNTILDNNGVVIKSNLSHVSRDNNSNFSIYSKDSGIFFAKLPLVQKEHLILIDNTTVFNDTIYDPEVGYRQDRIKVVGYKTDDWNGSLNIPGFTYDEAKVTEWESWKDYLVGELVKYKQFYYSATYNHSGKQTFSDVDWTRLPSKPESGLYPNWDYKANQFADFYALDTDNFDTEQQRLAQHLIGYQKREYLENIIQDDVSQYKFYQGFIQDKGTKNALTKMFDKLGSANQDSLEFFEEWAFRTAQYGALSSFEEVEYQLDESKFKLDPQLIELVTTETERLDLVYEYKKSDTYVTPDNYNHSSFPVKYSTDEYSKTGGYVKTEQVDYIATTKEDLLNLNINSINIGMYVWVPKEKQSWNVYKYIQSTVRVTSITRTDLGFIVQFDNTPAFSVGDVIGLNNIDNTVNNFWLVQKVSGTTCEIYTEDPIKDAFIDLDDSTLGIVTELNSRRVAGVDEINSLLKTYDLDIGKDRIWIDDNGIGKFEVIDNKRVYSLQKEYTPTETTNVGFGSSLAVSDSNKFMAIGSPNDDNGEVAVYSRLSEASEYKKIQTLLPYDRRLEIVYVDNTNPMRIQTAVPHNIQDGSLVQLSGLAADSGFDSFNDTFYTAANVGENVLELYDESSSAINATSVAEPFALVPSKTVFLKVDLHYKNGSFGSSCAFTPDGQYLFVGARTATNVRTKFVGAMDDATTYSAGDIVSQRNTLWKAKRTIDQDSSTINLLSDDWELVERLETDALGQSLNFTNQGVVHIYKIGTDNLYSLISNITSQDPVEQEQFGIAIKIRSTADFKYTTFIKGQNTTNRIYFIENKTASSDNFIYSKDTNYKGNWNEIYKYVSGEIVYYNGDLYQANTTVFAGDPWNTSLWTQLSTNVDYLGFVPYVNNLLDDDSSLFADGTAIEIAESYDISENGNVLAMSAYITSLQEYRVAVYRLTSGRYVFDEFIDSPVDNESFGLNVALDAKGDTLAITAQSSNDTGLNNGKVYLYTLQSNTYTLDQTLYAPDGENNLLFGSRIDFNNNKLAIFSFNGDAKNNLTLDTDTTYFDQRATELVDVQQNNNLIYIYENRNNKYIYAEPMEYGRNTSGASNQIMLLNGNHYYYVLRDLQVGSTFGVVCDFRSEPNTTAWSTNSVGENFVDIDKIKGVFLYNKTDGDLISYLDVVDPIQGRIVGAAEQELSYKLYYDPAIYNFGSTGTGSSNAWTHENVGKLWWDLSTVRWFNPYQGTIEYKSNTWNKIVPDFNVDVYEWVESIYLPSEWDELSDTAEGDSLSISGTTKYGDNSYTVTKVYDPVSQSFSNKYFYWINNATVIPNAYNRKINAKTVANLIEDPAGQSVRFVSILDDKKLSLHNCRSLIQDKNTILHFDYELIEDSEKLKIHNEYELLTEGLKTSKPTTGLVTKWIDSLVGYDTNNKQLPDLNVGIARRYGILNTPRQSMFVNNTEAVKQIVERVNSTLAKNLTVDDFDLTPLNAIDPLPSKYDSVYDTKIDSEDLLRFVGIAKISQATLTPTIVDGVITAIKITDAGRGYIDPSYTSGIRKGPTVEIVGSGKNARIETVINELGKVTSVNIINGGKNYNASTTLIVRPFTVLVCNDSTLNGFWATYSYNTDWYRQNIQSYDTTKYWQYKDWYAAGYDTNTAINFTVAGSYALTGINDKLGDVVKIESIGSGGWLLLQKIDNLPEVDYTINYKTVGRQNGTLQISKLLWSSETSGFDNQVYDSVFYDREPVVELRNVLNALQTNIFVDELEVEWNKLFFSSVRYALAEQANVDWVFKTSFVTAKHNVGELKQKVTYQNDNLSNYQDYVNEVKPYSSKVREYISGYEKIEPTQTSVTDFDLPTRYDADAQKIISETVILLDNELVGTNTKLFTYPQKHWTDNLGFEITEFVIFDAGSGYTDTASVTVSGGGGPTLTGTATLAGSKINFINVDTTNSIYKTVPTVTVTGGQTEFGTKCRVYAILGNSKVRSTHLRMKFDRISGEAYFETLAETATFTGTGSQTQYIVKWPIETERAKITITVNDVEVLSNTYIPSNKLDVTKGYDRHLGVITFDTAPVLNSTIKINYEKATSLLSAADRVLLKYSPTSGMPGKELSQVMDGVNYSGVNLDTVGFGTLTGFEASGYGVLFDTFDQNYEDEIFILDGSTQVINLSKPLEANVQYNVYKGTQGSNGAISGQVRLDDPNYPASPTNKNAVMLPLTGDGLTNAVFLDNDLIPTTAGDVIIIRKSTSDGSFDAGNTVLDVELAGGNFEYTTASGLAAGDINVDGDGFVTPTTSKGPEEQVPGQIQDTMDLKVYNRVGDGSGIISTRSYITDGVTIEYNFDAIPQSNTSMVVKIGRFVYDNNQLQVDWKNKTVSLADSTPFPADKNLSITTIGSNGVNILDTDKLTTDGVNRTFYTNILYKSTLSSFVTLDGVFQVQGVGSGSDYDIVESADGFLGFEFGPIPAVSSIINYSIYDGKTDVYSMLVVDDSFTTDGINKVHRWNGNVPLPVKELPLSHKILVSVNTKFLNPGYTTKHTLTTARVYDIDAWQFEDTTLVRNSDVFVYINGAIIGRTDYNYDPVNGRVNLLKNNVGLAGQEMEIFIIRDAEYYFKDTVIVINDPDQGIPTKTQGEIIEFSTTDDSTKVLATVETFVRSGNTVTINLQGYERELIRLWSTDDTPLVLASEDSTIVNAKITNVYTIDSTNLTLENPPLTTDRVRVHVFSNHDINGFDRKTLDVVFTTSQAPSGTQAYINKNMLQRGYIKLNKATIAADYVWVFRNGALLTPHVDYKLTNTLDGIQLLESVTPTETIEIFQFAAGKSMPKFGYRIFKDILNRTHYKRLNDENEYELGTDLNFNDQTITLVDATGIQSPNRAVGNPGILFINGERLEYYTVDGNELRQIRRGTLGTGVPLIHSKGTIVAGQGPEESIPYKDNIETTTFTGDDSTVDYELPWSPTVNANGTTDEAEIFVAGRRLRKVPLASFDKTLDQDSTDGDVTLPVEYSIVSGNILRLVDTPGTNIRIQIVRTIGKAWTENATKLQDSNTQIANFIKDKTISLPR